MKLCIVEPHADDAFLSVGWHIESIWAKEPDIEITICTVFSGTRNRGYDAQTYAQTVNTKWIGLGFEEENLFKIEPGMLPEADIYLCPIGIQHQEHIEVRKDMEERVNRAKLWYYLDQPYSVTLKNKDQIQAKIVGKKVVSFLTPHANKFKHIPIFKDQAKFFHYNDKDKLGKIPEIIVAD